MSKYWLFPLLFIVLGLLIPTAETVCFRIGKPLFIERESSYEPVQGYTRNEMDSLYVSYSVKTEFYDISIWNYGAGKNITTIDIRERTDLEKLYFNTPWCICQLKKLKDNKGNPLIYHKTQ